LYDYPLLGTKVKNETKIRCISSPSSQLDKLTGLEDVLHFTMG